MALITTPPVTSPEYPDTITYREAVQRHAVGQPVSPEANEFEVIRRAMNGLITSETRSKIKEGHLQARLAKNGHVYLLNTPQNLCCLKQLGHKIANFFIKLWMEGCSSQKDIFQRFQVGLCQFLDVKVDAAVRRVIEIKNASDAMKTNLINTQESFIRDATSHGNLLHKNLEVLIAANPQLEGTVAKVNELFTEYNYHLNALGKIPSLLRSNHTTESYQAAFLDAYIRAKNDLRPIAAFPYASVDRSPVSSFAAPVASLGEERDPASGLGLGLGLRSDGADGYSRLSQDEEDEDHGEFLSRSSPAPAEPISLPAAPEPAALPAPATPLPTPHAAPVSVPLPATTPTLAPATTPPRVATAAPATFSSAPVAAVTPILAPAATPPIVATAASGAASSAPAAIPSMGSSSSSSADARPVFVLRRGNIVQEMQELQAKLTRLDKDDALLKLINAFKENQFGPNFAIISTKLRDQLLVMLDVVDCIGKMSYGGKGSPLAKAKNSAFEKVLVAFSLFAQTKRKGIVYSRYQITELEIWDGYKNQIRETVNKARKDANHSDLEMNPELIEGLLS